jgi:hypothetical protein
MLRKLSVGRLHGSGGGGGGGGGGGDGDGDGGDGDGHLAVSPLSPVLQRRSSGSTRSPPSAPAPVRVRNHGERSEDHEASAEAERGIELGLTLATMTKHLDGLHRSMALQVNTMIKFTGRCKLPHTQHPLGDHLMDHAAARAAQRKAVSIHSQAWLAAVARDEVAQLIVDHDIGVLSGIATAEHYRIRPKVARCVHELREDTADAQELIRRVGGIDEVHLHREIARLDAKMLRCDID